MAQTFSDVSPLLDVLCSGRTHRVQKQTRINAAEGVGN